MTPQPEPPALARWGWTLCVRFAQAVVVLLALALSLDVRAEPSDSSPVPLLSRCAGKAGSTVRQGDPAFMTLALDGRPWMTIDRTEDADSRSVLTTITSNGWAKRRDGTSFLFRFTCVLNAEGQATMFHASALLRDLGDRLPPAIVINGSAIHPQKEPLQRGIELQIQLLDTSQDPPGVLTEQVVRSGWHLPLGFSLRLPAGLSLENRSISLTARVVLAHRTLFELGEPRKLSQGELTRFVELNLVPVADGRR
ncbi:YbaY family lipoprotein [uncultured Reyranella sp.]|jgi:uncharacterized lipoprotein YbaY|uniref:YbaY family lipoprotein n=1 Tax=uncultured Reyranella sp. TaxID=735512 RepID=UPI00259D1EB6|nr:YbaY family lipoprotein [uncultured Reyranella sp.]